MECLPLTLLIQNGEIVRERHSQREREKAYLKSKLRLSECNWDVARIAWLNVWVAFVRVRIYLFFIFDCLTNGLNKCNSLWKVIYRSNNNQWNMHFIVIFPHSSPSLFSTQSYLFTKRFTRSSRSKFQLGSLNTQNLLINEVHRSAQCLSFNWYDHFLVLIFLLAINYARYIEK